MSYFETGTLKYLIANMPMYPYSRINKKTKNENANPSPQIYNTMKVNKLM